MAVVFWETLDETPLVSMFEIVANIFPVDVPVVAAKWGKAPGVDIEFFEELFAWLDDLLDGIGKDYRFRVYAQVSAKVLVGLDMNACNVAAGQVVRYLVGLFMLKNT